MALQYARPDADLAAGDWVDNASGTSNLYSKIDEAGSAVDSSDHIKTEQMMPAETTVKFNLSNVDDPSRSDIHKIKYTAKRVGARDLTVTLYDGASSIVANTNSSLTTSYVEYTITLTAGQANSIGDYTDLRLWFTAVGTSSEVILISQAFVEVPSEEVPAGGVAANALALGLFD